jgi:tRNA-dihydrouridine synthase B
MNMKKHNFSFSNKLILAPMAEINNIAFRLMCRRNGADVIFSEMISANALVRNNKRTIEMTEFLGEERPFVLQLFGQNTDCLVKAAKMMEDKVDVIDLNFGCPSEQILQQGAGAALLKRPNKIGEIVQAVASAVSIPVTVKIRADEEYLKIAKICEEAGAAAITVHARTVAQGYSGEADSIPVIGNGDVASGESALRMLKETGCDSVMVGRAAIGNPYLFKQIRHYLKTGKELPPMTGQFKEWYALYTKHCKPNLVELKMNAQWFTKHQPGAKVLRDQIAKAETVEEILKLVL